MKLAPPVIPTSLKGGSRIVTRVETVAKGAKVDAVVTDSWLVYYGDAHAGTIAIRSGNPTDTTG
jgi:hypothetical protein